MNIKHLAVIGAVQMGSGIAQVFAQSNYEVLLYDINEAVLNKGYKFIEKTLSRNVAKERITEDNKQKILLNLQTTTDINDLNNSDLVVEAIIEQLDIKINMF